ncbi:hypothetical protein KKB44_01610 [Candidatus Micrarchaeota archaeon]|nr:hypothetical protein [Candidatus Micrarchaeota archaeon]
MLKRKSMYGLEIEMFTLNEEGKLVNGASDILNAVKGKKIERYVRKELSQCMIELGAKEKRTIRECGLAFIENLEELVEIGESIGYRFLPLGCHPGREIPKLHTNVWYDGKKAVLGKDVVKEGRISGFHFHYSLPEGIVGKETEMIKRIGRSKAGSIFIQQYNFLGACDPAILTFCQSTPIWMGINWAKDCRVLIYRDLKATKADKVLRGIHYYLPLFGSFPGYEFTVEDIRVMAEKRKTEWLKLLEQKNYPTNEIAGYPTLKFMWGPLRVNKIGTYEYRGPDMNNPSVIFSASRLLYHALKAIEKRQLDVLPSDIGIEEPFVLEDDTIYVPPHATLRHLEHQSVLHGFESEGVHKYCSNLYSLVEKLAKAKKHPLLKEMIDSKKTVSDEILDMVKKNGYDINAEIPEDMLNHISLYYADKLSSELKNARKIL